MLETPQTQSPSAREKAIEAARRGQMVKHTFASIRHLLNGDDFMAESSHHSIWDEENGSPSRSRPSFRSVKDVKDSRKTTNLFLKDFSMSEMTCNTETRSFAGESVCPKDIVAINHRRSSSNARSLSSKNSIAGSHSSATSPTFSCEEELTGSTSRDVDFYEEPAAPTEEQHSMQNNIIKSPSKMSTMGQIGTNSALFNASSAAFSSDADVEFFDEDDDEDEDSDDTECNILVEEEPVQQQQQQQQQPSPVKETLNLLDFPIINDAHFDENAFEEGTMIFDDVTFTPGAVPQDDADCAVSSGSSENRSPGHRKKRSTLDSVATATTSSTRASNPTTPTSPSKPGIQQNTKNTNISPRQSPSPRRSEIKMQLSIAPLAQLTSSEDELPLKSPRRASKKKIQVSSPSSPSKSTRRRKITGRTQVPALSRTKSTVGILSVLANELAGRSSGDDAADSNALTDILVKRVKELHNERVPNTTTKSRRASRSIDDSSSSSSPKKPSANRRPRSRSRGPHRSSRDRKEAAAAVAGGGKDTSNNNKKERSSREAAGSSPRRRVKIDEGTTNNMSSKSPRKSTRCSSPSKRGKSPSRSRGKSPSRPRGKSPAKSRHRRSTRPDEDSSERGSSGKESSTRPKSRHRRRASLRPNDDEDSERTGGSSSKSSGKEVSSSRGSSSRKEKSTRKVRTKGGKPGVSDERVLEVLAKLIEQELSAES